MKPTRKISRRSFMSRIVPGAVFGVAATTAISTRAFAQVTDSDSGQYADPTGHGRGRGRSGLSDRDPTDPAGNGRGHISRNRNCTDTDPSDPSGRSRFCRRR